MEASSGFFGQRRPRIEDAEPLARDTVGSNRPSRRREASDRADSGGSPEAAWPARGRHNPGGGRERPNRPILASSWNQAACRGPPPSSKSDARARVDGRPTTGERAASRSLDRLRLRPQSSGPASTRRANRAGEPASHRNRRDDPLRVVAVHPVPKRLTLMPAAPPPPSATPHRLPGPAPSRRRADRCPWSAAPAAQFLGREVGSRNCHCHIHSPQRISRLRESLRLLRGNRRVSSSVGWY